MDSGLASVLPEPGSYGDQNLTSGDWLTEEESLAALDERLLAAGLFRIYEEAKGVLTQPRPGQVDKTVRIDRVLLPGQRLYEAGWSHGAIGVEVKRSGVKVGPPIAQAMDYVRSIWRIRGIWIQLNAVFVWPMNQQYGPLESVMVHNRVGTASHSAWCPLHFRFGHENVLRINDDGSFRIDDRASGRKVGSR